MFGEQVRQLSSFAELYWYGEDLEAVLKEVRTFSCVKIHGGVFSDALAKE